MLEYKGSKEFIEWLTWLKREGWRDTVNIILYRTTDELGADTARKLIQECKLQEYGWGPKDFAGRDFKNLGPYEPDEVQGKVRCLGCQTQFNMGALRAHPDYRPGVCPLCGGLLASAE